MSPRAYFPPEVMWLGRPNWALQAANLARHKGYISSQLTINAGLTVTHVDPYCKG